MDGSTIGDRADIRILYANIEALCIRKIVELIIDEVSVLDVLFKADDGKSLEGLRLVNHGVKAVGIFQGSLNWRV